MIERTGRIPAPVGGWNAQLPLAAMPIQDAVILDNWVPRPGYVEVRKGYQEHATQVGADVETLIIYRGGGFGRDEIFAAAGTAIYDATTAGPVGAGEVTSLSNARWQYVNFSNSAGNYALAFNGADTPLKYNGSAWSTNSITGSGLASSDLIDAAVHKRRVFMVEQDTLHVWYLDVEAISGAATLLDYGPIFAQGGTIVAIGTWTIDGGQGADDMLVVVSSEGQVAIYQGTDPDDANNWALVGVYSVGRPIGRRSLLQYGADLVILTVNGVLPLSQALKFDRSQDTNVALTSKIQNAFATASASYQNNFGWEAFLYPNSQLAIYNVPVTELGTSYQFVQNVQTGAWARFKGINSFCWGYANGSAYFGGDDGVFKWDTGSSDNNTPITCDLCTAFSNFKDAGLKHFNLMRPIVKGSNTLVPTADIVTDYRLTVPTATITTNDTGDGMRWGSMVWGSMVWGSSDPLRLDWASCTGVGIVGAARMRVVLSPAPIYSEITLEGSSGVIELETGMGAIALEDVLYATLTYQVIGFDVGFMQGGLI